MEYGPQKKTTLFGILSNAYNNVCSNVYDFSDKVQCNLNKNLNDVKEYINTELINEDERKKVKKELTEFQKSTDKYILSVDKAMKKTELAMKTQEPLEHLRALYDLEQQLRDIINDRLDMEITAKNIEELLHMDEDLYENDINNGITKMFNYYTKNVEDKSEEIYVTETQKILFIGYLYCEPEKENNISPIPYGQILHQTDLHLDAIEKKLERICTQKRVTKKGLQMDSRIEETKFGPIKYYSKPVENKTKESSKRAREDLSEEVELLKKQKISGGKKTKKGNRKGKKNTRKSRKSHGKRNNKK
jgi:hypothetical protein